MLGRGQIRVAVLMRQGELISPSRSVAHGRVIIKIYSVFTGHRELRVWGDHLLLRVLHTPLQGLERAVCFGVSLVIREIGRWEVDIRDGRPTRRSLHMEGMVHRSVGDHSSLRFRSIECELARGPHFVQLRGVGAASLSSPDVALRTGEPDLSGGPS